MISSAFSTTWLLVTTMPLASMMKPDPRDCARRCWPLSPYSLKKSSKGEPGGNCGASCPPLERTMVVVEIFTTAGERRSAKSAKLSGRARACCMLTDSIITNAMTAKAPFSKSCCERIIWFSVSAFKVMLAALRIENSFKISVPLFT